MRGKKTDKWKGKPLARKTLHENATPTFKDPHPERQAIPSFRGYAYQAYQTIRAWLNCRNHERILCEFGEDIAIVQLDVDGKISAVELDQIKHRRGTITLRNDAVPKAIDSLIEHAESNPNVSFTLRVSTISDRGKEHGIDWQFADCGLDLWDRIRSDSGIFGPACTILRQFIRDQLTLSRAARKFVETADDLSFKSQLISRVYWDTGDQSYSEIQSEIAGILGTRTRPITDSDEIAAVTDRLWRLVTTQMASADPEPLTKQLLDKILSQETTAGVDRLTLRKMASGVERIEARLEQVEEEFTHLLNPFLDQKGGPSITITADTGLLDSVPSLPELCSLRREVVQALKTQWLSGKVLWIYGWTGSGKSTLANLLMRACSEKVVWCNFHGLEDFATGARLSTLLNYVGGRAQSSLPVVCDDLVALSFNTRASEVLRTTLRLAVARGLKVIVTSQASPSSRFLSEFADSLRVVPAPPLAENEIIELLSSAGVQDPSTQSVWARFLSAITGGHPQLVSARIVHAQEQKWKLSPDEILTEPRTVDQVKAEARSLLHENIPSEESREIARRLSVVMGVFTRDFAIDLGSAEPSLKEPGRAFDALVGPWIEAIGDKHFALSPLLGGYADAEFGQSRAKEYNAIAAAAWLKVKSVEPAQIVQMVNVALIGGCEQLLTKVSVWLTREPDLPRFAKQVALIGKISTDNDQVLSSFSTPVRFIFRQMQLRIAALNLDWSSYIALDRQVMKWLDTSTEQPFNSDFRLIHFAASTIAVDSPLSFSDRLSRALYIAKTTDSWSAKERISIGRTPIGPLILAVSSKAQTPEDLRYWVESLRAVSDSLRRRIFAAFDQKPEYYSIVIGHTWQHVSSRDDPDWGQCLDAYELVQTFAKESKNQWLAAAAIRASMLVLDEFLDDGKKALQLADKARSEGCDNPLIDFGETTIKYRAMDLQGTVAAVVRAERRVGLHELIVEQLFGLTYALRAAGILRSQGREEISKLSQLIKRGESVARGVRGQSFERVALVAFKAERAWLEHERGKYRSAVLSFMEVIRGLESFPDQSYRLLRALRLRVGHAIAWLSQGATKIELLETPYPGWCANLSEPVQELFTKPGAPYPMMRATLAEYAALVGETESARTCVRSISRVNWRQGYYVGALQGADALFSCDLIEGKLKSAVRTGVAYARLLSLGGVVRRKDPSWPPVTERTDLKQLYLANKAQIDEDYAGNIPGFVLAPILMAICSRKKNELPDFLMWRRFLQSTVGTRERVVEALDLVQVGYNAFVNDDSAAIEIAKNIAQEPSRVHEDLRLFATIFGSALKGINLRDSLAFQASGLSYAARLRGSHWSAIYCRMIRHRWIQVARNQPFSLITPKFSAQEIQRAAAPKLFGVPQCANLLIVAADAIGARWSDEAKKQLTALKS